jgi:hypothetical protein
MEAALLFSANRRHLIHRRRITHRREESRTSYEARCHRQGQDAEADRAAERMREEQADRLS